MRLFLPFFLLLCLGGCASYLGPKGLQEAHRPYNESIVSSLNEQFLLNLVRLRYRDNPYFVEIGSITSQQRFDGGLAASATLPFRDLPTRVWSPSASANYSSIPTITYQPMQGEDFLAKLMAPLPVSAVLVTTQSGWSVARVWRLTVEEANDLKNAPSASGPTPARAPVFRDFVHTVEGMRDLQERHELELSTDGRQIFMEFGGGAGNEGQTVKRSLGLRSSQEVFPLEDRLSGEQSPSRIRIKTRSILGILFFLSHDIDVPPAHRKNGLVTTTVDKDHCPFAWGDVTGDLLRVENSPGPPADAFVKVKYRGSWFFIRDDDLESKSTFMLLNQLFQLQAGDIASKPPALTIQAGGG